MNSDVIKLLPDAVANQIAAGEVIQRPASVIKELVENAVDAGATAIQIILKDAGRTLIQVVDNGCGMSATDARMAFERHATSKIAQATDLFTLHTMGFRGEALPSIAAVAQVDLRTMRHDDSIGTRLLISESKFEGQEPATCVPGTNLMVKNLFFHMPARRKFLKKDSVELSHIMHEFERLALVNTNIDFTLIHNDVTLHKFLHSTFKQRIGALFGKSIESQIIPVGTETTLAKINGFVGLPQHARKRGAHQYFFVNGRNMRHPYFHKAVMSCYNELISADAQPSYFINFEVDPSTIDVNIHPQKHEIKFEHEQSIWQILVAAIKQALGNVNAVGALDFDVEDAPEIPVFEPTRDGNTPMVDFDENYNPFDVSTDNSLPDDLISQKSDKWDNSQYSMGVPKSTTRFDRPSSRPISQDWEKLYDNFTKQRAGSLEDARSSALNDLPDNEVSSQQQAQLPLDNGESSVKCVQVHNRYIATPSQGGLMLIDQHRAHVRILFDKYLSLINDGKLSTQQIIFPESIALSPSANALLTSMSEMLSKLGFDLSFLGDATWAINGLPSVLAAGNPQDVINAIIEEAAETGETSGESVYNKIALAMARSEAIKSGKQLSSPEMESIIADLFQSVTPNFTPDGLTVLSVIPFEDIVRLFN
jgi:DNA mismatch repair protein MutL